MLDDGLINPINGRMTPDSFVCYGNIEVKYEKCANTIMHFQPLTT